MKKRLLPNGDEKTWSIELIGDATLRRVEKGGCIVTQEGRFCGVPEIKRFYLREDGYWSTKCGKVFENEADARSVFEWSHPLVRV